MNNFPSNPFSRRRRTAMAATLAAAALALAGCGDDAGSGSDETRLIKDGQLVVAMSGEFRPFSHYEDNELTGFDYDIGMAIGDEMGLDVKTETGAFDTLIQGLKSKRYDVLIASMTPTDKREKAVDFTDSYYTSGATVFVKTDSDCEDPTKLDKPSVGVATGTTYQDFLNGED
ncbi:transporter substrate-binding domain-containing protein [Aeromicrobium sp.]|uniref:transporter substrate-binding domain-containing protein n=1 Tax=Aeromicrobium sp. TaxID=1871063 RepID=UPI0037C18EF7